MTNGSVSGCTINDGGTAYSGSAVFMDYHAKLENCTLNLTSTTSARAIRMTNASGAGSRVSNCTLNLSKNAAGDYEAIRIEASSDTVESTTINCVSAGAVWAITAYATNPIIRNNVVRHAYLGVDMAYSGTQIYGNVFDVDHTGIQTATAGYIANNTMYRSTCDANATGILVVTSSGSGTISNNLFYNFGYGTFYSGGTTDTYSHNIYFGSCASGSNRTLNSTQMANKEPLFCLEHESPVQYFTQRIDSEAAAGNNGWGELVGAKDVECAWGTLARNTTVASNTTFRVLSDVVVANGNSLTINSGASVEFDNDDDSASGSDNTRNELVVAGALTVSGSGSPVVFGSAMSPAYDGDWYGISARYATSLNIDYADISKAVYGVVMRGTSGGTNTVSHSTFIHNTNYDIEVFGDSSPAPTISNNTISPGVGSGIVFTSTTGAATISDNTITANGSTVDGIYLSGGSPTCTNNTISGATYGNCFTIVGGSPTLTKNKPKDSKYGIHVSGGTPNIGSASDTTSDNIVTDNSSAGAYFTGSSTGGVVRQSRFTGNAKGIVTKGSANPDLGNSGQDGKNIFAGNTTYCVQNQSTSGTVSARGNYLNGQNPPTCHNGSFDLTGYLTTLPSSVDRNRPGLVSLDGAPLSALGVTPNPITGTAGIRFLVRREVGRTGIQIYDVAGRLIKTFPESIYPTGEQIVTWDGRSGDGQATVNGLYFVRISSEKAPVQMIKILVSR